ncbi:glutathione S-transferase family protein [Sphingomonas sp.]|jgi:glutathione S-transferase|uniref:glutathione S-transferase family protein n=1 Tax=Sphingomonas sp. TaxID=28214 RepID=UPI002E3601BF|nr:glutathione S-transferase family protein [Sphingomonas sp.]HEX4693287.1 glutathione S-transferase family protein [Sphingomonas sp.]
MSKPVITAFSWVPPPAQGQVRDLRVRWALEEVGQAYDVRFLDSGENKQPPHRARQPFGQVPTYEQGDLTLFESGAIVLHIAEKYGTLLPTDPAARARAIEWMFAALNSVEPMIMDLSFVTFFEADKPWSAMRRPAVEDRIHGRLTDLSARLGDRQWLDGDAFTAGDLLMVSVLRIVIGQGLVETYDNLAAYMHRGIERPAFQRALADQMAGFTGEAPDWFADWAEKMKHAQGETA